MALVAVAVTLGTPNSVGQVPITTTNLAAEIAQAVTDLATLQTAINTAQTAASAADGDMATLVTDLATDVTNTTIADNDAAIDVTNTGAVNTDLTTAFSDYDTVAAAIIAITGDTYNSSTHQFTFGGATGLTHAQWAGASIGVALNAALTAFVTAQTAATTASTSAGTTKTATAAAKSSAAASSTQGGLTKTATALTVTDANLLSTATVSADLVAAQAIIALANVYVQTDTTVATNVALLNGALISALSFVRGAGILPT